jgi:Ca2+/Na+ antiporter
MKIPANLSAFKKPMKQIEIVALVIFVVFLLFPFRIPSNLAKFINHPLGFLVIFVIIVFLFLNAHPIVAFVYLLVAYELVRRSSNSPKGTAQSNHSYASSSHKMAKSKVQMNPVNGTPELNNTDKDFVNNYNKPSYTSNPNDSSYELNYAPIGLNTKEEERKKNITSQDSVGNTLEEDVIRNRIPANGLHPSSVYEQSSYSPVYDKSIYGSSI